MAACSSRIDRQKAPNQGERRQRVHSEDSLVQKEVGVRTAPVLSRLGVSVLSMALTSCSSRGECLVAPCPLPQALSVRVHNAATSGPVDGATLQVSGAVTATLPCSALCYVPGTAGIYVLDASAPGLASRRFTVTVGGANPECGCPSVVGQHLDIALSPIQ